MKGSIPVPQDAWNTLLKGCPELRRITGEYNANAHPAGPALKQALETLSL